MFRRGLKYLHREIDWAAIIGSAFIVTFCLLVLVPAEQKYAKDERETSQRAKTYIDPKVAG